MPYISLQDQGFGGKQQKQKQSWEMAAVPKQDLAPGSQTSASVLQSITSGNGLGGMQGPLAAKLVGGTPGAVDYAGLLSKLGAGAAAAY